MKEQKKGFSMFALIMMACYIILMVCIYQAFKSYEICILIGIGLNFFTLSAIRFFQNE